MTEADDEPIEEVDHKCLKHIFGLTFLNPDEVSEEHRFDLAAEQPTDDRVIEFTNYVIPKT